MLGVAAWTFNSATWEAGFRNDAALIPFEGNNPSIELNRLCNNL